MYQFSRAIYRELARDIADVHATGRNGHEMVLKACEANMERLSTDRHYFARPARTLFTVMPVPAQDSARPRAMTICAVLVMP